MSQAHLISFSTSSLARGTDLSLMEKQKSKSNVGSFDISGDGRALCQGRMWDIDGNLLVTVAQEGVMRHEKVVSRL